MRNKNDGIYQRPDSPYWWASWTDGGGAVARRSTRIKVADDPRGAKAMRIREELMAGEAAPPEPAQYTFDELMRAYMMGPVTRKSIKSQRANTYVIGKLFTAFEGWHLDDIKGSTVRAYVAQREGAGAAANTIRAEVALMCAATNWAIRELEWPIANPWVGRKPQEPAARDRWLTRDEADRLIDAAERMGRENPRWTWLADYIRLCLYAGLRRDEASKLTWDRVDLGAGVVRFAPKDQKNGKVGAVPLNRQARMALAARRKATSTQWVFPQIDPVYGFNAAARLAGIKDVHIHDLRRTFGSWLAQDGVPIQQISKLMRHSGVAVTDRVYAHLSTEVLAQAAAVLDEPPRLRVVR